MRTPLAHVGGIYRHQSACDFCVSEPALANLFPFQMVLFFRCLRVQPFSQLHPSLCDPLEFFREIGR
jgi:hypothetical protein